MESNKQTAVAMLITDIVLFCIMLVGLLRLRQRGGGMFELGRLLWKQVRLWQSLMPSCSPYAYVTSVHEGVIWLLIAAAAEIPPTVCPASFLIHSVNDNRRRFSFV
jgi:hypothetical protein